MRVPHRFLLVGLVAGAILLGSLLPTRDGTIGFGPLGIVGGDLWLHAGAYAILAVYLGWALAGADSSIRPHPGFVLGAVATYGLALEVLQVPTATRTFQVADLSANVLGAVFGLGARHVLTGRRGTISTR